MRSPGSRYTYGSQGEPCRWARRRPAEPAAGDGSVSRSGLALLREEASIISLQRLGKGLWRRLIAKQPLQLRGQRIVKGRGGPVHIVTNGVDIIRLVPGCVQVAGEGIGRDHLGGNRLRGERALFHHQLQCSL